MRTDTSLEALFATARSCTPSPLKSPTATEKGFDPTVKFDGGPKLPVPVPMRTDTLFVLKLGTARSCTPSPLKSPTATESGRSPTGKFDAAAKVMPAHAGGVVTVSIKVRVVEPPGPNALTVTVYAPGGSLAGCAFERSTTPLDTPACT